MNTPTITAIILTYNEEMHIKRCIDSLADHVDTIVVVDSYSEDDTVKIAKEHGAVVHQNKWVNYATQFNWALENCNIQTDWVWRIDADEYYQPDAPRDTIRKQLQNLSSEITGVYVKRKIVFMERELLHGGWFPVWHLKIWKFGKGACENRWMDEHITLSEGETTQLTITQVDENLNDLTWWTDKHNKYAVREMVDMLDTQYQLFNKSEVTPKLFGTSEQRKRFLKLAYINFPLFLRPLINFIYRYILKLGFLDGTSGFVWHVLQGFWYRFLVDAKIYELKLKYQGNQDKIKEHIKKEFQIK